MRRLLIILTIFVSNSVLAGPAADAMTTCLADSTTGKDRKELARWIFAGMTAHPDLADLSNVTSAVREKISQNAAGILTRLLAEDCAKQARAAGEAEGPRSVQMALAILGQLAMQELMSNQDVSVAISAFEKYLDQKKINAALESK